MRTMKIAYLMSRFPHLPETFILREMDMLKTLGNEVFLFPLVIQKQKIVHPNAEKWLESSAFIRFSFGKIFLDNISPFFKKPMQHALVFFKAIKGNFPNIKFMLRALYIFPLSIAMGVKMKSIGIEHIHAHYATHPALAAWIIHQFTKIPYSITVHAHDIFVDQTMMKEKMQSAAFIRAISMYNKKFLIEKFGKAFESKIYVIHTGIEPEKYSVRKINFSKIFQMLNIGSLQPYKGQEFLIRACAILRDDRIPFKCMIIGQGELRQALLSLVNKLKLNDQVQLAGGKTEDEIREMLPNFDCYIQPSIITESGKMEGIPVANMEAMACGIPVIATEISGVPELVRDGKSGYLVPPANVDALVKAIKNVIQNPQKAFRIAQSGRRFVKREFALFQNMSELDHLFRQL